MSNSTGANLIIRERKLLPNPVPEFVSVIGSYLKGSLWIYWCEAPLWPSCDKGRHSVMAGWHSLSGHLYFRTAGGESGFSIYSTTQIQRICLYWMHAYCTILFYLNLCTVCLLDITNNGWKKYKLFIFGTWLNNLSLTAFVNYIYGIWTSVWLVR